MRLVRFGPRGQEKPGIWRDGRIVDLRCFSRHPGHRRILLPGRVAGKDRRDQ